MLRGIQKGLRFYSTIPNGKPLLMDILPSRKIISRLLFDYDARHNYNKYLPVIESIYDATEGTKVEIPVKFRGNDLLIYQRVLAQIRKQTHTINPLLLQLENDLIEYAADRGSRDALCTLSFMALDDNGKGWTEDDKNTAKKYIKQLMEMEHPLAFKLAGDRELKGFTNSLEKENAIKGEAEPELELEKVEDSTIDLIPTSDPLFTNITSSPKQLARAISLYEHFLTLDYKSTVAASAYRSMGMIYFRIQDLIKAKDHFERAVSLAPASDNAQAHFFLGLLNEIDPMKARYHFQMAAGEGFRESFANLGYLELNVFNELTKAREWFALGSELGVPECVVGLFDVAYREKDWKKAKSIINRAQRQGIDELLIKVREESVGNVLQRTQVDELLQNQTDTVMIDPVTEVKGKSRWDI
jgi:protein MSS2